MTKQGEQSMADGVWEERRFPSVVDGPLERAPLACDARIRLSDDDNVSPQPKVSIRGQGDYIKLLILRGEFVVNGSFGGDARKEARKGKSLAADERR
jgi:hypothetical protein